ncbi:MAG: rhomboid family intramembrane serine protease [Candidatus Aenigmarchaeota archaeon]|nr:rhomboid family intramembrane serine protease [Candidatus Aenigmarchaeota archaeon]
MPLGTFILVWIAKFIQKQCLQMQSTDATPYVFSIKSFYPAYDKGNSMRLTLFLIFLCIAGFVYTVFFVSDYSQFFGEYGFSGEAVATRPWILLTSIFLHGSLEHLLSNILVLFFFGAAVESELGMLKMLALFFTGAFFGDFVSLFFYSSETVAIGASAGIFALVGLGMIVRPFDLSLYPFFIPVPLALLGVMYSLYNAIGFIQGTGNISYAAHFGGLFIGLAFGFKREGWKRGMLLIVSMLLILLLIPYIWKFVLSIR